ncbi:MAG: hypothetical protein AAFR81_14220 [Chloroflexota bacterium]
MRRRQPVPEPSERADWQALLKRIYRHWAVYRLSPNIITKTLFIGRVADELITFARQRSQQTDERIAHRIDIEASDDR